MIPIARPTLGEAEIQAVSRAIASGWITQGPEVAAFEKEFAAFVGAPFACAVSNCTTALHLSLRVVGVGPGDEVVTVSHSFIATANSIRHCGATPVFVDLQEGSVNVDPELITAAVTSKTKAILCVHQLGMPCDAVAIAKLAKARGIPLIEDAACAIGSEIQVGGSWEKIGKPHGDIACFSFHPRKLLTTGDGGMITTRNADWDRRLRHIRQHGMMVSDTERHASAKVIFETYGELGYNYRLTDLQAALGREQLKRIPGMVKRRRELAQVYRRLLAGVPGITVPGEPSWARTNWQSFWIVLPEGADQKGFMQKALDAGIATRRGVMCAHREPAYSSAQTGEPWGMAPSGLRRSEAMQDRSVILPLFHDMTESQVEQVAQFIRKESAR